jgi:hypothetical protein
LSLAVLLSHLMLSSGLKNKIGANKSITRHCTGFRKLLRFLQRAAKNRANLLHR